MGAKKTYNFTEEEMKLARKMREEGAPYRKLAETFGGSAPMWHCRLDPDYKKKSKAYYEANKERAIARARERYWSDPESKAVRDRMVRYGLSEEEVRAMMEVEHCQICERALNNGKGNEGRVFDHCHDSGKVRGVLCNQCNRGLGFFRDSENLLSKAQNYLTEQR